MVSYETINYQREVLFSHSLHVKKKRTKLLSETALVTSCPDVEDQ